MACLYGHRRVKPCRIAAPKSSVIWPSAGVAELVDALDLGSSGESRGGSSPSARTNEKKSPCSHYAFRSGALTLRVGEGIDVRLAFSTSKPIASAARRLLSASCV